MQSTNTIDINSWKTKITLLLASSLTVMSGATISPALPAMNKYFATQMDNPETVNTLVKLVITTPALFIVIASPIAGLIVDRFGRKPLLLITTIIYGAAGSTGLYLDSLTDILLGRALLGLAVAGVMVSATTLIADYYTGNDRANFMGLQAGFMGLGGVLFLSLGGLLAEQNWRFPFGIYLFAWLFIPLILMFIVEPERNNAPVKQTTTVDRTNSLPIVILAIIYGLTVISQVAFYLIPVQLPFLLETLFQAPPTQSGLAIALCTLFSSIASVSYGKLKQKIDFATFLPIIFACMGIGYLLIGQGTIWLQILVGLSLTGVSLGLLMPNMNVWLSSIVPDNLRGRALGGLSTALFLGQFLSPILSQPLVINTSLSFTYAVFGGILFLIALLFTFLKSRLR